MNTGQSQRNGHAGSYDVVAIGAGPFNLGLAALAAPIPDLSLAVFDDRPEFRWHPGLMFDDALLQVSFLSDLVTLIDPTSPYSFLNYLRDSDRLYPFLVREQFRPTRREYEDYLRWVVEELSTIRFGKRVTTLAWEDDAFTVETTDAVGRVDHVRAADLVVGIGTEPSVPAALAGLPADRLCHSGDYLTRMSEVDSAARVTVIGSGQSGAEIVLDLLRRGRGDGRKISWLTRTPMFAPLDFTRLDLEMTTPSYMRYFHALPEIERDRLVAQQWQFHKGISTDTLDAIHDELYRRRLVEDTPVNLSSAVAVEAAEAIDDDNGGVRLSCHHRDTGERFAHHTDLVIAATGYTEREPTFLEPVKQLVKRDSAGRPVVRLDHSLELGGSIAGRIFVANADTHSHGVSAPNLDIGAVRNATILNTVSGREIYRLPERTAFTTFGPNFGGRP